MLLSTLMLEFMNKISFDAYHEEAVNFDLIQDKINQVIEIFKKGIEAHV
jgi:hypothetical protein